MKEKKQKVKARFFKFMGISSLTGVAGLGTFALLIFIYDKGAKTIPYNIAVTVAEYVSVLSSCVISFLLNSKFTFTDRKAMNMGVFLYILFYMITTPLGAMLILYLNNLGLYIVLCKIVKMTINVCIDYVYCRFVIFRYIKKKYDEEPPKDIFDQLTEKDSEQASSSEDGKND